MDNVFLRPKNILIVGGGSGIGFATAQNLLNNGAENIVLLSRNIDKLASASNNLIKNDNQHVYYLPFDITNISAHLEVIIKAQEMICSNNLLDGLVISSGVNFDGSNWKGFNISESDYDKVMDTNLKGVFFLIRNFSNYLFEHKTKGNICVVSSISAHRDMLSPYQISKHCISGIIHTYGKYLGERGVILNGVEPGPIYTDMMKWLASYTDGIRPGKPWVDNSIGRLVRPEEIADIIVYLMSNLGEVMSGTCIVAAGGAKSIYQV